MKIIDPTEVADHLSLPGLIPALRQGFLDHYAGTAVSAPITNMDFPEVNGEVHIKPGYLRSSKLVCVKMVTCFYDNPAKGRPTRDGAIAVASRETGQWLSLVYDGGRITDLRTCGASAVAVDALRPAGPIRLGLIGLGTQAAWHIRALACVRPITDVQVWGRDDAKAQRFAEAVTQEHGLECRVSDLEALCQSADVIVSATPARAPVIPGCGFKPGAVVVAMGADAVGKRELTPQALAKVQQIVCDDVAQCQTYGEAQWLSPTSPVPQALGAVLKAGGLAGRQAGDVVLFDSTGLGFQDAVGVELLLSALGIIR